MGSRSRIKREKREGIWKRDGFRCQYCGRVVRRPASCWPPSVHHVKPEPPDYMATIDHIIPLAMGGTDERMNLITACWRCNKDKGCSFGERDEIAQMIVEKKERWRPDAVARWR